MPPLSGGGETNYRGIREEDNGNGTVLQVETQEPCGLRRVRRDADGRLPVESSDDSTREGGRETAPVYHTGHREDVPELLDVLSGKGGTANMPCGGVPEESGDKDGNAGALRAPACPRHRGDSVGRKLPPPTVRPVRHAGLPEGAERAAPGYRTVPQGSGTEETAAGGGGDVGEFRAGV